MAIVSKDKLFELINTHITDNSDETLEAIADITDTVNDFYDKSENADRRVKDIEEQWRTKYRDRFFKGSEIKEEPEHEEKEEEEKEKPLTYDSLFKKGE